MHSCFEEEFPKPSVLSEVVGVALFSNISWPEIHKLSKLLPYFSLIQHNRRICFAHQRASANQSEDDVTLMSHALECNCSEINIITC